MNSATISREYWFSAAHRLEGHPKCGRLHGHNYRVVISLTGPLSADGMVMDYGELDAIVKPWLDSNFDHKYLISTANLNAEDPYAKIALELGHGYKLHATASTAEVLAHLIHQHLLDYVSDAFFVTVRVDETPKSSAVYPV